MQKSYKEYAEIFKKYGIKGATLQVAEELEKHHKGLPEEVIINKPAMLLGQLGHGGFDTENYQIIPSGNGKRLFLPTMVISNSLFFIGIRSGLTALGRKRDWSFGK